MNKAIRVARPQRGWICSVCGAQVSTRYRAEEHCPEQKNIEKLQNQNENIKR